MRSTAINHHLQCFPVDGVHCVPLDARLPFALARFVREQITFDVTVTRKQRENMSKTVFLTDAATG